LIVEDAEKQWQSALATLANLVGDTYIVSGVELQEPAAAGALPANVDPLIDVAMAQRPDLLGSRAAAKAAHEAALAARAARYPTVSLAATAGVVPTSDPHFQHNFAAGGINVNVPVFTGGLYAARQREAEAVANAADASLTQSTTELMRDVRLAWLEAKHAEDRIGLTRSLAENARAALELARARFDQGLTSTIELTQAELAQTSADIALTTAQYDYRIRRDMVDYVIGALR
jgi:outer membrane protein